MESLTLSVFSFCDLTSLTACQQLYALVGGVGFVCLRHLLVLSVFSTCGRREGVQGVLTLFCSGAVQVVCHALRVEELSEQLEVEEEDGDRRKRKK